MKSTIAIKAVLLGAVAMTFMSGVTTSLHAQGASGLASGISEARAKNAKLMKDYSWNSRVEISENGETKDTRIDQVTYGPDGGLQYTLINDVGSPLPHGFLRRRIAEKEKEGLESYIKDIRGMLNQYTLPTASGLGAFLGAATIKTPDADGVLQITGSSVVVPGDTYSLSIYAPTRQPRQLKVMTTYQGDEVTVSASFKTLSNGLNYMAYATISIPGKNLTLQVHNYDYINQNN
jgi:hypothetical protein